MYGQLFRAPGWLKSLQCPVPGEANAGMTRDATSQVWYFSNEISVRTCFICLVPWYCRTHTDIYNRSDSNNCHPLRDDRSPLVPDFLSSLGFTNNPGALPRVSSLSRRANPKSRCTDNSRHISRAFACLSQPLVMNPRRRTHCEIKRDQDDPENGER